MARKQNTDAPVAADTDTATTAESTAIPAPTVAPETTVEVVTAPVEPEVSPQPSTASADPHERFKSITPDGLTMYNFR